MSETERPYRLVAALIGGIATGWFLIFFGVKIPVLFGFEPSFHPGETFLALSLLGFTFGFYLGRAMEERHIGEALIFFVFISSFLGWVVTSLLIHFPPIFFGNLDPTFSISLALPTIISITLYISIFGSRSSARKWYEKFCGQISFLLLNVHIGYAYQYPFTQRFLSLIQSGTYDHGYILGFLLITGLWIFVFLVTYYLTYLIVRKTTF